MNDMKAAKNLLFRIASEVANEAKDIAPYLSGNLKKDSQVFTDDIDDLEVSIGNFKLAPYAPYVHQGTGKRARGKTTGRIKKGGMKPQPYLENGLKKYMSSGGLDRALDDTANEIKDDFVSDLKNKLQNMTVKL